MARLSVSLRLARNELALPLRGRASELDQLNELLVRSSNGQGGVALLEGPAGIGKTRLLAEVSGSARARGHLVASGVGDEMDEVTPWGALLGALGSSRPAIFSPDELPSSTAVDRRLEMTGRIRSSLARAAERQPVLITVDDLQWADPLSLSALGSLPQEMFSYPIVWVLAGRPVPDSDQLQVLRSRLDRSEALKLRLGPLAPEHVEAIANDVRGAPVTSELLECVRRSQGNPLYLMEVLRYSDSGRKHRHAADEGLPATLTTVVRAHLRSLSEPARRLVKVASVLGTSFSACELSEMTGLSAAELLPTIEETVAASVFVEETEWLTFGHDLFRQAVYDELPASARLALHKDAAAALLATGGSKVRIANHLAIGAVPGDEQAVDLLLQAIADLSSSSPSAAADVANHVLRLTSEDDPRHLERVTQTVSLLAWAGRLEEARDLGEHFLAEHDVPPALAAEIHFSLRRPWSLVHYAPPLPPGLLDDDAVPPRIRADLIVFEQLRALWDSPPDSVAKELELAGRLLEVDGNELDKVVLSSVQMAHRLEHGRWVEALESASANLSPEPRGEPSLALSVYQMDVALCLMALGRLGESLEMTARATGTALTVGQMHGISRGQSYRSLVLLELGRLDDALAEAGAAVDTAEELGSSHYMSVALGALVETSIHQGLLGAATAAVNRLRACADPDFPNGGRAWALALVADARGQSKLALASLADVLRRLAGYRFAFAVQGPSRLAHLAGMALRAGDPEGAATAAAAAAELARRNPDAVAIQAASAHTRGLATSDPAALRAAVALWGQDDCALATAMAHEDLGVVLGGAGGRDEAVEHLEAAYAAYQEINARRDLTRARQALHALGVRKRQAARARPVSGWASLTDAEVEVARIVAEGSTNQETATRLFVSPETVNTHLRHIFAKLGINSRRDLAKFAN